MYVSCVCVFILYIEVECGHFQRGSVKRKLRDDMRHNRRNVVFCLFSVTFNI